jgi:hypothetical protein
MGCPPAIATPTAGRSVLAGASAGRQVTKIELPCDPCALLWQNFIRIQPLDRPPTMTDFTVVNPTYNRARQLSRAIESVLLIPCPIK